MNTLYDHPQFDAAAIRSAKKPVLDRILVPMDFSTLSETGLEAALSLAANKPDISIDLVHVVEPPSSLTSGSSDRDLLQDSRHNLEEARIKMKELKGKLNSALRVTGNIVVGRPAQMLCQMVRDEHYDLVVISTHGRSGLERILVGSVAETIIHDATCPVLVVKPSKDSQGRFEPHSKPMKWARILVGYDHRPGAGRALSMAQKLAERHGNHLTLIHAVPEPVPRLPLRVRKEPQSDAACIDEAAQDLNMIRAIHQPESTNWEALAVIGHPWDVITDHARKGDFDLIVVGPHEHSRWGHEFMGSTAQRVVRLAHCAVLVIK